MVSFQEIKMKELVQEQFLTDKLLNYKTCKIKYADKLNEISIEYLVKILKEENHNYSDMKAVFCLFNTLFSTTSEKKTKGLPFLNESITKYIKKMELLVHTGEYGNIYKTEFFSPNIHIIIKFAQEKINIPGMLKEYYVGLESINRLRYLTPVFVYTLGAFYCSESISDKSGTIIENPLVNKRELFCGKRKFPSETLYILYENIEGDTVDLMLENNTITFNEWLILFFQLLLGLEIAQREIRFTHFDMHCSNVMARECKSEESYDIHLDMKTYKVSNPKFIPIIIDFGSTTTFVENNSIGSYRSNQGGHKHFMVPGHDMYKFLVYSASTAKRGGNLQKNIMALFDFYKKDDPYNILNDVDRLNNARDNFCARLTTSTAANYTPLMFIEWLMQNYHRELSSTITEEKRYNYLSLQYTDSINKYDKLFNYTEDTNEALQLAKKCITLTPSYIVSKYNITILERFNQKLKNKELELKITTLSDILDKTESDLISNDIDMLEKVFTIKTPDQNELNRCIYDLLQINLKRTPAKEDNILKEKLTKKFELLINYQEEIQPYLQFYFTILDLNIDDTFLKWIVKFESSSLYKFYVTNITQVQQSIRWSQTLMESRI
jgi:hypothetical protein